MWEGHGFLGGGLMWLSWIVIIALIVWLVRGVGSTSGGSTAEPRRERTPLEILEERFARGEIDEEEFQQRKRLLNR
ncbi:MAG: SHOCT domain-containing protein [Thiotrichales bacterium]